MAILPHFASLGYVCEEHDNPADFVLDILATKSIIVETDTNVSVSISPNVIDNDSSAEIIQNNIKICKPKFSHYFQQLFYLSKRNFSNTLRNPALLTSQIISAIVYGLFTGLIFNKLENIIDPGIYNRFGAIFFIVSCQILSSLSALEPLLKERALFIHVSMYFFNIQCMEKIYFIRSFSLQENISGYYGVSNFFLARLLVDLPLTHVLPSIIYSLITFYLTGLQQSNNRFVLFFTMNILAKCVGTTICYLIAASTSTFGENHLITC